MASTGERIVWRLTRPDYAPGLDGEGARLVGGRWSSPGRAVVYCSATLSLSVLESFVHLPHALRGVARLPEMTAVKLELPPDAQVAEAGARAKAGVLDVAACRALGDRWLARGDTLALSVPSAVVPEERNFLINPLHPQAARVSVLSQESFRFDPRMATE